LTRSTHYSENNFTDGWNWTDATFHCGVIEAFKATGNRKYYDHTYRYAEGYSWESNHGWLTTHYGTSLDDIASCLPLCMMHALAPADYKLVGIQRQLDWNEIHGMLDYSWVDEIYMIGLAQSYLSKVTGDPKYSENDRKSYLFYRKEFLDTVEGLWYRDAKYVYGVNNDLAYSSNGKKVFWGRGNAWVYVSLAQRLEYMEKSDPAYELYLHDYLLMSNALRRVQRADGVWNPNLGDPYDCSGMEMTGTGGFLYGLSMGIRLGLLDEATYLPVVTRAYETITEKCITEDGFLGYCQPVGWMPSGYTGEESMKNSTSAFGVGLMLMGLSQYMRLCADAPAPTLSVEVEEFDPANAIYTVDEGWYKSPILVTTSAQTQEHNGPQNLVNGNWRRDDEGSRLTAYGLASGPIVVNLDFYEIVTVGKLTFCAYADRAYKMVVEAYVQGKWVPILDTTQAPYAKSYLHKFSFEPVSTQALRVRVTGCWGEPTLNQFSMREMLIYEA